MHLRPNRFFFLLKLRRGVIFLDKSQTFAAALQRPYGFGEKHNIKALLVHWWLAVLPNYLLNDSV